MKLVFDLDGVLRLLYPRLWKKYKIPWPREYIWTYKNKNIYEWVKQDKYKAVRNGIPTQFLSIVKKHIAIPEIWTYQPEDWRKYTIEWLNMHIGKYNIKFYTTEQKREALDMDRDIILVEDCPLFTNYEQIALIDYSYNRDVNTAYRIKTILDFERLFTLIELLPLYRKKVNDFLTSNGRRISMSIDLNDDFLKICEYRIIEAHKKYGDDWKNKRNLEEAKYEMYDIFNYNRLNECQDEYQKGDKNVS